MKMDHRSTRAAGLALGALLALCASGASAQVFKWKDAKGVTHYSDTPPPGSSAKVEVKALSETSSEAPLPYGLAVAVRGNPVTLFTSGGCAPCEQGRALLKGRGIPFSEKTVASAEDQQALAQAGSAGQLPLLLIGGSKLTGFEANGWNEALTAAAYPTQRTLPTGYRYPAPQPAAPPPPPPEPKIQAAAPAPPKNPPAANAPPGFQF